MDEKKENSLINVYECVEVIEERKTIKKAILINRKNKKQSKEKMLVMLSQYKTYKCTHIFDSTSIHIRKMKNLRRKVFLNGSQISKTYLGKLFENK
jgi:hypothetical protein